MNPKQWHIIPSKDDLNCPPITHVPSKDRETGEFKIVRAAFPMLRMTLSNGQDTHRIVWSNVRSQEWSQGNPGRFSYKWPPKLQPATYKACNGRTYEDTLTPPKVVDQPDDAFEVHANFIHFLTERFGAVFAGTVYAEFARAIVRECFA